METEIIKIAALAITGIITTTLVRAFKPEFAIYVVIATVIIIFAFIAETFISVFSLLEDVYGNITYGRSFFPIIVKVLIVAYVADFTAQLCRDTGESAIAGKVELAGKVIIFYMAIPILVAILELINTILV